MNSLKDNSEISAELQFSNADAQEAMNSIRLPELPEDCLFGDGGAHEMIENADAKAEIQAQVDNNPSSSMGQDKAPQTSTNLANLDAELSFSSIFMGDDRRFNIGSRGVVVRIHDGVTEHSTGNVASLYKDNELTERIGTISTAEPVCQTRGLKATCDQHRERKQKHCLCWLRFAKKIKPTADDRLQMFRSLCQWLDKGGGANER